MGTFRIPASKASIKQNVFVFDLEEGGKKYRLPYMQFLRGDISGEMQDSAIELRAVIERGDKPTGEQMIAISRVQRKLLQTYVPEILPLVTNDQIVELIKAWQLESKEAQGGGSDLGESSASSSS